MTDLNKLRSEFEATPEIKAILEVMTVKFVAGFYVSVGFGIEIYTPYVALLNFAWDLWQEKAKAQAVPEGYVLFPTKSKPEINEILGMQCFQFIRAAQTYRKLGFEINKKAEAEQAFFLFKFLHLALEHGDKYLDEFNAETRKLLEANESGAEG
ncbi:hypothetical protein J596_0235 [Acinetobacter baumannii 21072]|uniref:Uncharacterized protein n=1 Tax=Acinetobacter baumannii 21072 TaxID=1310697 RepID=A0A062IVY5_ACIBA|nr:hypothetical protein [Acinetobacter baumannii]KCY23016.1 hypothetical protein J596_0235 [Acinetobacter baumannii 21072]